MGDELHENSSAQTSPTIVQGPASPNPSDCIVTIEESNEAAPTKENSPSDEESRTAVEQSNAPLTLCNRRALLLAL